MRGLIISVVVSNILLFFLSLAVLAPFYDVTLPMVPELSPVDAERWAQDVLSVPVLVGGGLLAVLVGLLSRIR